MRQPKFRDDLYELLRSRMAEKYGSDKESANVWILIKLDIPRAVITETPPEELQIIHNTES